VGLSVLCLAAVSASFVARARPGTACDSSSCAILTRGGLGTLTKGAFAVDLSFRYTDEGKGLAGSSATRDVVLPRIDYSRASVGASVQVKAHFRGRGTYLDAPVPSTGSRMVILSPGLRVTTPGGLGFYAYQQVPVYRHVNDAQLAMRSSVLAGVSRGF